MSTEKASQIIPDTGRRAAARSGHAVDVSCTKQPHTTGVMDCIVFKWLKGESHAGTENRSHNMVTGARLTLRPAPGGEHL